MELLVGRRGDRGRGRGRSSCGIVEQQRQKQQVIVALSQLWNLESKHSPRLEFSSCLWVSGSQPGSSLELPGSLINTDAGVLSPEILTSLG